MAANLVLESYTVNTPTKYTFQIAPTSGISITDTIIVTFDSTLSISLPVNPQCIGLTSFNTDPLC